MSGAMREDGHHATIGLTMDFSQYQWGSANKLFARLLILELNVISSHESKGMIVGTAFGKVQDEATLLSGAGDWSRIKDCRHPLIIERRQLPFDEALLDAWVANERPEIRQEGLPTALLRDEPMLPQPVRSDVVTLAYRFAALMDVRHVRMRLETIVGNACRKIHADQTDVRLICTYVGPGTEFVLDPSQPDRLDRLEAGWIGLFKGRTYAVGHEPAYHRSPPIAGTGIRRLLVVIDTPLSPQAAALLSSVPN
jgi:hypothetical protein